MSRKKIQNNTSRILERVRHRYHLDNGDNALADFFDVEKTTISAWRQRDSIPEEKLIKSCGLENLKWLLTGEGPMRVEEKTGVSVAGQEHPEFANGRYDDVYIDVREILSSGDDFIIRALRERLKDFRIAVAMNRERRDLKQRLTLLENEMRTMKGGGGGSPGERPGGAGTDAGTTLDTKEGDADIGKKAM